MNTLQWLVASFPEEKSACGAEAGGYYTRQCGLDWVALVMS
jgi:hypothetical protein